VKLFFTFLLKTPKSQEFRIYRLVREIIGAFKALDLFA